MGTSRPAGLNSCFASPRTSAVGSLGITTREKLKCTAWFPDLSFSSWDTGPRNGHFLASKEPQPATRTVHSSCRACLALPWNCQRVLVASKASRSQCLPVLGPRCPGLLMLRGGCALEFPGKGILICRLRNAKEEVWAIKFLGGQGRTTGQKPDWDGRLAKPWCVT